MLCEIDRRDYCRPAPLDLDSRSFRSYSTSVIARPSRCSCISDYDGTRVSLASSYSFCALLEHPKCTDLNFGLSGEASEMKVSYLNGTSVRSSLAQVIKSQLPRDSEGEKEGQFRF